jgi:hypothetical protein
MKVPPQPKNESPLATAHKLRWPKHCIRVTVLPHANRARIYLQSLGFELWDLLRLWRVKYCRRDPTSYPPVFDRIVVPFFDDENLLKRRYGPIWKFSGWQALSPREAGSLEPPTGITPEGMAASGKLYGLQTAIPSDCPVVIVDSVVDVWRLGFDAVSTFGMPMSHAQEDKIVALFRGRPVVVASKRDADEEKEYIAHRLTDKRTAVDDPSPVQVIHLPALSELFDKRRRAATWKMVRETIQRQDTH